MLNRIVRLPQTLYVHKKKTIFFSVVAYYAGSYIVTSKRNRDIHRSYCVRAQEFGDQPIVNGSRPRRIIVVMNRWANEGKARKSFEDYAAPLLHLSGHQVDVVRTESKKQTVEIARAIKAHDADAVLVVGGDGTLSNVLSGMLIDSNGDERLANVPVAIYPVGKQCYSFHKLIEHFWPQDDDSVWWHGADKTRLVRQQCESVMALIHDVRQRVDAMRVQVDDDEPSAALSQLHAGTHMLVDTIRPKYWYMFRNARRFSYAYCVGLKGWHSEINGNADYQLPCTGCKHCHQMNASTSQGSTARNQKQSMFSWLFASILAPTKPTKTSIDYSKIDNDQCKQIHKMRIDADELIIENNYKSQAPSFQFAVSAAPDRSRLSTINEGNSRNSLRTPHRSPTDEYYAHKDNAKLLTLRVDANRPLHVAIDGEKKIVNRQMTVKSMPAALDLFLSHKPIYEF